MARRMADPAFRQQQWEQRYAPHIEPVNRYVDELRTVGREWVPYVAPLHGGTDARVLSILQDPGPATRDGVGSGFVCVENNDGSAELQANLLDSVGLTPRDLLPWNAYPWYINRAPKAAELDAGVPTILQLLSLAPDVRVILLQGADAQRAWRRVIQQGPHLGRDRALTIVETLHPSPQALFAADSGERERRRQRRIDAFAEVAMLLNT